MSERPTRLRCALYTRKSTEEGLDQAFNSLHAQREACEAYVKSQVSEGWAPLKTLYDDGGFSGGSMERPALRQLLADIDAGLIDVVVVYKVDRLTRSLFDFGRIIEKFDAKGVSFVSVTQAFNTTTSMGRLTLNVLLSFAQFEREVTGERIRDKIAASKKKGMWMGGGVPYGYDRPTDLTTRALVINPQEAAEVQAMFARYLELGSVHHLARELSDRGVVSKLTVSKRGTRRGGVQFTRGPVFHILKNRVYVGDIVHKDAIYPGVHPAIIDRHTFEAVQERIGSNLWVKRERVAKSVFMLTGKVFDAAGLPMCPTSTRREGRHYRYYVSSSLLQGSKPTIRLNADEPIHRVPATALEELLHEAILPLLREPTRTEAAPTTKAVVLRVDVDPDALRIKLHLGSLRNGTSTYERQISILRPLLSPGATFEPSAEASHVILNLPVRMKLWGGKTWLVRPKGARDEVVRRIDPVMAAGIRNAHQILRAHGFTPAALAPGAARNAAAPTNPHQRKLCRLALLAPDLQTKFLEGGLPTTLNLDALISGAIPLAWEDQRGWLMAVGARI